MKRTMMMVLAVLVIFASAGFIITEARDLLDCECWWAWWDEENEDCYYYFCLKGGVGYDYYVELVDPITSETYDMYLHLYHNPCARPCYSWRGVIEDWDYDPSSYLHWYIYETAPGQPEELIGYHGDFPPC